jgi:hypothetical protein
MDTNFGQVLQSIDQSALADEIVAVLAAVVSDMSAPGSALGGLRKSREESLTPEQQAAAAALQAYGVECASEVFTAGLEPDAKERASRLGQALQEDSAGDVLSHLRSSPDAGAEFKSRLSLGIAIKCADLVAAEIDRAKKGHFTILNEEDAAIFEARREEHRKQRAEAAREFLASLPSRYPSFGAALFATIRRDVQRHVEEQHKRPDTKAAVASLFDNALASMPAAMRETVNRAG